MDREQLKILERADGCLDTIKKRAIVLAVIVVFIVFNKLSLVELFESVPVFALVITPLCAVPYRMASMAFGRKIYMEDGISVVIPSRLFGWAAAIAAFALFGFVIDKLGTILPTGPVVDVITLVLFWSIGLAWLASDIHMVMEGRRIEAAMFEPGQATEGASGAAGETDFFAGCTDEASVKERYRSLMKIYHPDMQHGDTLFSKIINTQYGERIR